jgi:hypothetical protein
VGFKSIAVISWMRSRQPRILGGKRRGWAVLSWTMV